MAIRASQARRVSARQMPTTSKPVRHPGTAGWCAVLGLIGAFVTLAISIGLTGFDGSYAVLWGGELLRGQPPTLADQAPTAHPLAVVIGAVFSLWPAGGRVLMLGLSAASFAGCVVLTAWVAASLTQCQSSARRWHPQLIAASLAAVVLALRPQMLLLALTGAMDPFFAALCLGALLAVGAARPTQACALLGVASLQRPEAWVFLLALLVVASWPGFRLCHPSPWGWSWLALGPAGWGMTALLIQNPLTVTQDNAVSQQFSTGLLASMRQLPAALTSGAGTGVVVIGALGAAFWLYQSRRQSRRTPLSTDRLRSTALGLLFLDIAAWFAQGVVGTPLVARYLVLAHLLLIAIASAGVVSLFSVGTRLDWWRACTATAAICVVVVSVLQGARHLPDLRRSLALQRSVEKSLVVTAQKIPHGTACPAMYTTVLAQIPVLALLPNSTDGVVSTLPPDTPPINGWVIVPRDTETLDDAGFGPATDAVTASLYPSDFDLIESHARWSLYGRC